MRAGAIPKSPTTKLIIENSNSIDTFSRGNTGNNLKANFLNKTNELTISALAIAIAQELKTPIAPKPINRNGNPILPTDTKKFLYKIYLPVRKARKMLSVKKSIVIAIVKRSKSQPVTPARRKSKCGEKDGRNKRKMPTQIVTAAIMTKILPDNNWFLSFGFLRYLGRNRIIL